MYTLLRHFLLVFVTMSLGLYGVPLHAESGPDSGTTSIVICSGDGPVTLVIDSNGNPVTPQHKCCDCLTCTTPVLGLPSVAGLTQAGLARFEMPAIQGQHQVTMFSINARPHVRGPPSMIWRKDLRFTARCGSGFKDSTV
jgi:hypothetical protein